MEVKEDYERKNYVVKREIKRRNRKVNEGKGTNKGVERRW